MRNVAAASKLCAVVIGLSRVGLAQALINDPEIVFLDEPMSGLDPIGRREIRELIAELRAQGKTIFMSTHILSDIEALCDNVAILRKLDELLANAGEGRIFEVNVKGVNAEAIGEGLAAIAGATLSAKPNGANIQVQNEKDVETVLATIRKSGGKLESVQPVRQSLEELFVRETN